MVHLANFWAGRREEVFLLTLDDGSQRPFFELHPQVTHVPQAVSGNSANRLVGVGNNIKRLVTLRRAFRKFKPDTIISFVDLTNILTLLAARGLGFPVVVAEHSNPFLASIPVIWQRLRRWTYPWADGIVVLNRAAQNYFSPSLLRKTTVIPNPVIIQEGGSCDEPAFNGLTLVAMGRISEEKGLDFLIQAFARLKDRYPDWKLIIMGEGPLRSEMEGLCRRLRLSARVRFLGLVSNPFPCLKKAGLFVLPSRFEGFPMALCEAMACGLPVISTDYHSGVRDIIQAGENGILVPVGEVDALAAAMDLLMGDEAERKRIANKAVGILDRFGRETIMNQWEAVIKGVSKKCRPTA